MKRNDDYEMYDDVSDRKVVRRKRKNVIQKRVEEIRANSDDLLGEISDDDFYVDEIKERRKDRRRQKEKEKNISKTNKRKPVSPMQRRIRRIVSTVIILGVFLTVCIILSLTVLFKTQNFVVTGTNKYTKEEIVQECGIHEGDNIFLSPKAIAEWRIEGKFPYVEECHVGVKIPDTITINIKEAVESYLVKINDSEYLVISSTGKILKKSNTPNGIKLPLLIGPKATVTEVGEIIKFEDEDVIETIDTISKVFADNGYSGITEINASVKSEITFTYDGRIKVILGVPENLSYKIRTAMTIIKEKIDVNKGIKLEGILDVSKCDTTKRSYFSEASLLKEQQAESQSKKETKTEDSEDKDDEDEDEEDEDNEDEDSEDKEDEENAEEEQEILAQDQWYVG